MKIPLSILELALIVEGSDASCALKGMLSLARQADRWGYKRFWLAEHHNMAGIASSSTAVLVGQVAACTQRIRVGSGGVMLPNHAPLIIAEQFGTLSTLFPGRIDLGVGRAPGTDAQTTRALRRHRDIAEPSFPHDVLELRDYLAAPLADQPVRAVPGYGTEVPIWILGSSLFSAQLAAHLGLPFAFASHFAPEMLMQALAIYRSRYRPSTSWPTPYAMVTVNAVAAPTDDEAARLFTSLQLHWLSMFRGTGKLLQPPVASIDEKWSPAEREAVTEKLQYSLVGGPESLARQLAHVVELTQADELLVSCQVHNSESRNRSFEILANVGITTCSQNEAVDQPCAV